jgi:hypothetical protein
MDNPDHIESHKHLGDKKKNHADKPRQLNGHLLRLNLKQRVANEYKKTTIAGHHPTQTYIERKGKQTLCHARIDNMTGELGWTVSAPVEKAQHATCQRQKTCQNHRQSIRQRNQQRR